MRANKIEKGLESMHRTRTIVAAAAVTATVAGGLAAAAGTASAMPTDLNTCQAGQAAATVAQAPNVGNDKVFTITFRSAKGASCVLTGSPRHLTFFSPHGAPLGVSAKALQPESSHQEFLRPGHPVQVRVRTPQANTQGALVGSATFTMANSGKGVPFTVKWTGDINGPALVGMIHPA